MYLFGGHLACRHLPSICNLQFVNEFNQHFLIAIKVKSLCLEIKELYPAFYGKQSQAHLGNLAA